MFVQYNSDDVKRLTLLITGCLLFVFLLTAQAQKITKSDIIETYKGVPCYIHFVRDGETLAEISRVYNVTDAEIVGLNPYIKDGLQPNQVIKIPVKSGMPTRDKAETSALDSAEPVAPKATHAGNRLHTIEPKETWYGLSRIYEVPVKELLAANPGVDTLRIGMQVIIPEKAASANETIAPLADNSITVKSAKEGYALHKVLAHETLYSLSRTFGITVEELQRLNPELAGGLKAEQLIYVPLQKEQTQAVVPIPQKQPQATYKEHKVERKETLYSISKKYEISISDLLKANPGLGGSLRKGDIVKIPQQNQVEEAKPEVVQQNEIPAVESTKVKPAGQPCSPSADQDKELRIALLIPFQLEETDSIAIVDPVELKLPSAYESLDFIQFYEGAMLAVDSLKNAGLHCKLYVYDADAGEHVSKMRRIISNDGLSTMDLIIGPFFSKSFEMAADYAASHSIPIVNPLSQRSEILKDNPYVFKAQPSLWTQYNETARYIADKYADANVIILRRNSEENKSMAAVLHTAIGKHSSGAVNPKDLIYSESHDAGLMKSMVAGRKNVIFMLTADKALLPALLRNLNDDREKYDITVFGLPEWENMDLDVSYMLNLDTHLFSPWFVDYTKPDVYRFVERFRENYKTEPGQTELAYLGYDLSFFFIRSLMNYGRDFQECLSHAAHNGLSTGFRFWKTESGGYENTATSVYRLKDYKRYLVNR